MSDFTVSVDFQGTVQDIAAVQARADNLTPVWEGPVDRILRSMFALVFETRGQFIGKPWAPLSPVTEKIKAKMGRLGFGPLRLFDRLYRSLTVRSATDQVKEVTPASMTFGTSVPYAHLHQDGWNMKSFMGRPVAPRFILPRKIAPEGELPPTISGQIEAAMLDYVLSGVA